jgi:hypothetical protein
MAATASRTVPTRRLHLVGQPASAPVGMSAGSLAYSLNSEGDEYVAPFDADTVYRTTPAWPNPLSRRHQARPSVARAQTWLPLALMRWKRWPPETGTGTYDSAPV